MEIQFFSSILGTHISQHREFTVEANSRKLELKKKEM